MHVLRYVFGSIVAAVPLTWFAIANYPDLVLTEMAVDGITAGIAVLALLTLISLWKEEQLSEQGKRILMSGFILAIMAPTLFTVGAYIHGLETSWSGGEVHYHADYEVIVEDDAGEYHQLDLIDPSDYCERSEHESAYMCRLNDRTGAVEYHEHNDRRIHLEGTFKTREDAALDSFFELFGGELTNTRLVYPTNERTWELSNTDERTLKIIMQRGVGGDRHWCAIGPEGTVSGEDVCHDFYTGRAARSPSEYVVSPYQRGPPLDDLWLIYDSASVEAVLQDVREDDQYKQFQQEKTAGAEGY